MQTKRTLTTKRAGAWLYLYTDSGHGHTRSIIHPDKNELSERVHASLTVVSRSRWRDAGKPFFSNGICGRTIWTQ